MLADPRRARHRLSDALWIRLTDVPKALALRRYACPADLVIEVTDELLPGNAGRWRLATSGGAPGPDGAPGYAATCERATGPADVALDVATLGAAYLGGTRLGELAGAGLVTERRPGAVAALSAAMSWDPAPWCPLIF
jgi:predicted acetyltransferase